MNTSTTPVAAVMTPSPVCARLDTPVKEIAEALVRRGISAVAVVDRYGAIAGVVSERDLLPLLRSDRHRGWLRRNASPPRTARDVMTSPALTVAAGMPVADVAARMAESGLRRLFVVAAGRPVGVVARRDLVGLMSRPDSEIEHEVTVLLRKGLRIGPDRARVMVHAGVVTVAGRVEWRSEVASVTGHIEAVPGVVEVCNGLDFVWDDVAR
ncbi:CBS domain-containing protein [Amycolatopsis sp. NPDC049253]|uniref:CBS domain-containing protein n=1 Tax=Amycolatopsis sp. NPDC049253 TaxID=3155274 RepID=UPI00341B951E